MAASPFSPERALVSKWRAASAAWQAWGLAQRLAAVEERFVCGVGFLPSGIRRASNRFPGFQLPSRRVHWTFEPSLISAPPLPRRVLRELESHRASERANASCFPDLFFGFCFVFI
ncbi:unnamed protein product [Ixodes pacificus]